MQFLDWQFTADLGSATHVGTDTRIRFTRAERAVLQAFVARPERVYHRNDLLDVVSGQGSDVSDRSIDFLINRLRRKLGDSARAPRYIQTRYGEGYVWIAEPAADVPACEGAFIVVGPLRGLEFAEHGADTGRIFARGLVRRLDGRTAASETVCLEPACPLPAVFDGEPPRFAVELNFFAPRPGGLDCAVVLRAFTSRRVRHISRVHIAEGQAAAKAARLADTLIDELWQAMNYSACEAPAPDDEPLPVRLHASAEQLAVDCEGWQEAERRLRTRLHATPDDAETQIKLAATLHTKYVVSGPTLLRDRDPRREDEAEIERLVSAALPEVQTNDVFSLMAAKLLYFVNASHRLFAVELAESALEHTTAFASAFATVAQLRAWEGDIEAAVTLYDQGLALAEPASHFDLYLRILKCEAELAVGDGEAAARTATRLYEVEPRTRQPMALFFAARAEIDLTAEIEARLDRLETRDAFGVLRFKHYLGGRLFRMPTHRANVMRRPVEILAARFGAACIPPEVHADLPDDLAARYPADSAPS